MLILSCTKRFADLACICFQESFAEEKLDSFENWYVHLFFLSRRKCLIFTNAETLFSFFVEDVLKKDLRDIPGLFRKELFRAMFYEEFGTEEMEKMKSLSSGIIFTKTQNRRVLGSMNDMIYHYSYYRGAYHVTDNKSQVERIRQINRLPMSMIGMEYPSECFQEKLKSFCKS